MAIARNPIKKQLLALGYRTEPEDVAQCIEYLKSGKTRHWIHSVKQLLNQRTIDRIATDYDGGKGKLSFVDGYFADRLMQARKDPARWDRYAMVVEAEGMAPHKWWNLADMRAIGMNDDDARALLTEYDQLRFIKSEQVVSSDYRNDQGEKIHPAEYYLGNFSLLPRYIRMLYEMYYRNEYRDASPYWIHRASYIRHYGKDKQDARLVEAADDTMRYRVWEEETGGDRTNRDTYYQSLGRFTKNEKQREALVKVIRGLIQRADDETRNRLGIQAAPAPLARPSASEPVRKYGKRKEAK